jgi:hypothetical protein
MSDGNARSTATVGRAAYRGLQRPAASTPSHHHSARGTRVQMTGIDPERTHVHRTSLGVTDPAPNRPGHRHRLPTGDWTSPSSEVWSNTSVARL